MSELVVRYQKGPERIEACSETPAIVNRLAYDR